MTSFVLRILRLVLLLLWAPQWASADSQLLIISGLGGESEFSTLFHNWSSSLINGAQRSGIARENIVYLSEDPSRDPQLINAPSSKAEIGMAIRALAERAKDDDDIFIFLFGHGSYRGRQAYFNIPGPDISAREFAERLEPLQDRRLVFVNASSSSGPFVRALSAPKRVIVTATSRAAERYFPEFGGYFIAALDSANVNHSPNLSTNLSTHPSADTDKDNRISILEAFNYAKREVKREYDSDKRLLTEHALLDDNADKEGSREPDPLQNDGALAASFFVYDHLQSEDDKTAENPRLSALLKDKASIEKRIQALKIRKAELDADDYYRQLEELLVELALNLQARRVEQNAAPAQEQNKSEVNKS